MKKTLIFGLIFALSLAPTGVLRAQTAVSLTPEAQASLVADIQKQINDLMVQILLARIAELQAQITELIASQTQTQTTLGSVEQKVDSVVNQTAPIPVPIAPSLVVGNVTCSISQELYGNINNTGVDGYADVYNIRVPVSYAGASKVLEHSETNLPSHVHKDRTATSTQIFTFSVGGRTFIQEVVVPVCN